MERKSLCKRWALCLGLLIPFWTSQAGSTVWASAETLVLFDPSMPETPKSIVFDRSDNAYISLALTGEIRKIGKDLAQSTVALMPIEAPCGGIFPPPAALGLAFDKRDRLYVAVSACDPANQGIWRVNKDTGAIEMLGNVPGAPVLSGIDVHKRFIYAADTFAGLVWRMPKKGGVPKIWADDPLLKGTPGYPAPYPGPNGLKFFRGEIYVAVLATGNIIAIPILADGTSGEARVHATLPPGQGCDEFALDARGSIYCTTGPSNTVIRLDPDGTTEILLTAADFLDGPTSAAFGRKGRNRKNLYITNAAFPWFPTTTYRPSLMRLRLNRKAP